MVVDLITNTEAKQKVDSGEDVIFLDARSEYIYTSDSDQVQGAIHMPENLAREIFTQLPKEKEYLVYATKGDEDVSLHLANFLREKGFTAYAIKGGYEDWRDSDLPIEPINAPGTPLL